MLRRLLPLVLCLSSSSALAMDVNLDIINQGVQAWDFAVVLTGTETVTQTYNGFSDGVRFSNVAQIQVGGDKLIHWTNPTRPIQPGELFHIGWSTADHTSRIKDMYFTDRFGQRIKCSSTLIVGGHFSPVRPNVIAFTNAFDAATAIAVRAPRFMVAERALPLADLTSRNGELMGQLRPLAGDFEVRPGQTVEVELPIPVAPGQAVNLVYDVTGPGTDAQVLSFVQLQPEVDGAANVPQVRSSFLGR
jgi:hypothetical protein